MKPTLNFCPSLFKYILIVQRGFTMVFHLWLFCISIRLTPSITLLYPFSHPYYSTAFSVFRYAFFLQRFNVISLSILHVYISESLSVIHILEYHVICEMAHNIKTMP
jgi:hypothetical protein